MPTARPSRPIVLVTFPDYDTQHEAIGGALTSAGLEIRLAPKRGPRSPAELSDLLDRRGRRDRVDRSVHGRGDAGGGRPARRRPRRGRGRHRRCRSRIRSRHPGRHHARGQRPVGRRSHDRPDVGGAAPDPGARSTTSGAAAGTAPERTPRASSPARRWGCVGLGRIGRRVAARLRGFDVELLVHDPPCRAMRPRRRSPLDELLQRSDIVSIHCPLIGIDAASRSTTAPCG